jgi:hypothetical protein
VKTLAREHDKEEVLGRMKVLRPDSARRWGRMSAHQMVCHLSDAFLMGLGQKAVSDAAGLRERTMIKWIALYLPVPWPGGRIRTRPEIDQEVGGTTPGDFPADVARLEGLVARFTAQPRNFDWPPHPIFGRISASAWLRWGYLHMDHHLRQFGA